MYARWMTLGLGLLLTTGCVPSGGGGGDDLDTGPAPTDQAVVDAAVDAGVDAAAEPTNQWVPVADVQGRQVAVDGDGALWIAAADGVWRDDGEGLAPVPFDPAVAAPDIYGLDLTVTPPLAAGADGEAAEVFALREGQWAPTAVEGRRFDAAELGRFTQVVGRGADLYALVPGRGIYEYDADAVFGDPVFSNVNSGAGGSLTTRQDAISALFEGSSTILAGTAGIGVHQFCDQGGGGGGAWCPDAVDPLDDWNPNYPTQNTRRIVQIGAAVLSLGSGPPLMERGAPLALPFAPADWLEVAAELPDGARLADAAGLDPSALWLVGDGQLVVRGGAGGWAALDPGAGEVDYVSVAVRSHPEGVDVWLVTREGLVLRCQGPCDATATPCDDPACVNLPEAGFGEPCAEPGVVSNCAEGLRCTSRALCAQCEADAHCGEGEMCALGECRAQPAAEFGQPCTGSPGEQAECRAGLMCDEELRCVVCRTTMDCPANAQCVAGRCDGGLQHGDDCIENGQCGMGLLCTERGICGECDTDADCDGGTCNGFALCDEG